MTFELIPEGSSATISGAEAFVWPSGKGATESVVTDVGAWLGQLGSVSAAAIDLVRLAAGAYMADRRSARNQGFSRTIELHVQLVDPAPWEGLLDDVADLLFWLSGDIWHISVSADGLALPGVIGDPPPEVSTVALLSGGLDSFCGAVIAGSEDRLFLGHWDNPTIKGAQNAVKRWLDSALEGDVHYEQLRIVQAAKKRESSSRTRALLFMALAAAVAESRHAKTVEVPENGYTSLNPPLGPERGGALSTRSTHPKTISDFNRILEELGLAIRIRDVYAGLTKGQLVARATEIGLSTFEAGVASTLSCGKLDGGMYKGGNPNYHCGLCFPCLVRRGAIAEAEIADATVYLSETLTGAWLAKLRSNRKSDILAVKRAIAEGFRDETLIAMGPFPAEFDFDRAVELCEAGLAELGKVDLD
jgi:7-cyano-7-deazaguanine synthase in queuosine biosynthesis